MIFLATSALAQQEILQTDTSKTGTITFRRYDTSINPKPISEASALLKATLHLSNNDSLKLVATLHQDKLKLTHLFYQQYYKGIKVLYATYAVHAKEGIIKSINGHFLNVGNPSVKAQINEQAALAKALSFINAKVYGWEDQWAKKLYKEQLRDSTATLYPKGELVIFYDDSVTHSYRLSYKFNIYAVKPLSDNNVFIDAITGNVIGKENLIRDANATGTAATKYNGSQTITTDTYTGGFRLREVRNGVNIQTYNMQKGSDYNAAVDCSDADNNWTAGEYHDGNQDDAALDVHWATEKVYDYWNTINQRNSWDGAGAPLTGYVHTNLVGLGEGFADNDNAFWDRRMHIMTYGDGQTIFNAVTSLDVVAHETAHGFTEGVLAPPNNTPILSCQGITCPETASLNEGISDGEPQ